MLALSTVKNLALIFILPEWQKRGKLTQSISDASWGELIRQLAYKCEWYGRELIKIDRWFPSSKRCGNCGHIVEKMPLDVREWDCPKCQVNHDRDINAAHNILAAGLAVIVCGANIRPDGHKSKGQLRKSSNGKKQKPKSWVLGIPHHSCTQLGGGRMSTTHIYWLLPLCA